MAKVLCYRYEHVYNTRLLTMVYSYTGMVPYR